VRCVSGELLTVASLNTRGIPLTGSRLAERYAAIGAGFDAGDADVVCVQEVFTYWHLRFLVRRMRSFRRVSWRPGPFGPMGGLVTFSRRPVSGTAFRRFGRPPRVPGVPRAPRGWPMRSRARARPRSGPNTSRGVRHRIASISS